VVVSTQINDLFASSGCIGSICALRIDGADPESTVDADEPVFLASWDDSEIGPGS
jgi:hypothetical protein